jgi:TetR/AcrR family transcriptional regulator
VFLLKRNIDYKTILGDNNLLLRYPKLFEAAIDEFAMKRYEDASLNDILKKSGMSKGSLYHHLGDKFGLYLAMMDILIKKKLSFFYPVMQQTAGKSSDFFSSLKEILKATMDFMLADERMYHLFNRVMEESKEFRSRLYDYFPFDYSRSFYDQICQAVRSGQINTCYPPEFVAGVIEIMFSNLHKLVSAGSSNEIIDIANQVVDMIQYGISGIQSSISD